MNVIYKVLTLFNSFYFLAVLSLLIFRYTEPDLKRPYRVWLSTPILFCMVALFLCTTPFIEAPTESAIALGIVLLAIPIWLIHVKFRSAISKGWDSKLSLCKIGRKGSCILIDDCFSDMLLCNLF